MNLIRFALRRPFTILVAIVAVALGAWLALAKMPRDVFPSLGVPTIYVAQPFGGMDPAQMEGYLAYYYEYHFLYITALASVESKSIQGATIIKLTFHPGTDMAAAMAETIGYVNRARAFMPPGTVPPFVTRFDAGSVPVGQLVFSSESKSVAQMQDAALNMVRPLFATLPGVSAPPPFGGSARSIVVNLKPDRLRSYGMSPDEVVQAIAQANAISPSGNITLGDKFPMVPTNAVVKNVKDLEAVPLRLGEQGGVFVRDVAEVGDMSDIVTSYALVNGRRTVYLPVTKRADASTLAVVDLVKANLPKFQAVLPDDIRVSYEFDQSPYVTHAIGDLMREGWLGALLTAVMIVVFLRDWRSAAIVVINIPLSLLAALLALWWTKQTINLMTLGGLALAVGILVDEATVTIENIHTAMSRGSRAARAALDATAETAVPRLLAMLCVLAVFIPAFFMTGAAKALFVPLALAVGFSMLASYLLSSTLVPILSVWLLRGHDTPSDGRDDAPRRPGGDQTREDVPLGRGHGDTAPAQGIGSRLPGHLTDGAERRPYLALLARVIAMRRALVPAYLALAALVVWFFGGRLGTEIFPKVDAGQLQLRLRAPTGTRIDKTEAIALQTLDTIKTEAGAENVALTMGLIGTHPATYPVNLIHLWNGGPEEGVLQVQFKPGTVRVEPMREKLRAALAAKLPGVRFSFEPSDIISRVMSLGSPTPIEVAVSGADLAASRAHAEKVRVELAKIPALRDLNYTQAFDYPTVDVAINRERAGLLGVKTTDATKAVVTATSSSRFTTPVYWADPKTGVAFQVQVQIPQAKMTSLDELQNLPISAAGGKTALLRNLASLTPGATVGEYDRLNMARLVTLTANIQGSDLGSVSREVERAIAAAGVPPPKTTVITRGQVVPLNQMLDGLRSGLLLAVVVIFLLLAANFQSLRLPLIVVSTVPAVLAGVALALWMTRTTLNLESFMGAIMAVGVAVANAILLVTFAERARLAGATAADAAAEGARSRRRPILMTSCAMLAGMAPMALGLGEGGAQTAPLGRAVMGGLAAATVATLFILPAVFALLARKDTRSASLDPDHDESAHFHTTAK